MFLFKMKNNEDIRNWIFASFLMVYIYSDTEIDQLLTVYRNQSVGCKSVEIFGLSANVQWLNLEKVQVSNLKTDIKWENGLYM